jgi:photosystem II stability/assembly factor-like uncharacterized protein
MVLKMKFLTEEEGYVVSCGQLYRTFDGGENRETIPIETGFISSCTDFSWQGGDELFVSGTGQFLFKSEDNEQSWKNLVEGPINDFKSVYFLNEQQGFSGYGGIDGPSILRPTDGGLSWQHANNPDIFTYTPVSSFGFDSEANGWAAFTSNQIFETNDGGLFLTSTKGEIIKSTDYGSS